jgi:hypothetical protein
LDLKRDYYYLDLKKRLFLIGFKEEIISIRDYQIVLIFKKIEKK